MTGLDRGTTVARQLDSQIGWIFARAGELAQAVADRFENGPPRRAALGIEERVMRLLGSHELPLAGSGFVAAPGVLRDAEYWLEWWTAVPGEGLDGVRRLTQPTSPGTLGFRDYTVLPWYAGPRDTGRGCLTGPYVDYLCTDQHTLTFTRPVLADGAFVGVVGLDVLAETVERQLTAPGGMPAGPGDVLVIVNAGGRVIASTDPMLVTGDLMRGVRLDGGDPALPDGWSLTTTKSGYVGVLVLH